jgi:6-phosphogluconolactonase
MKLKKMGRVALASTLSLAIGLGVTACSRDYVLAYLYVTTAKPLNGTSGDGGISAFSVDYQAGSLLPLSDSPIPVGRNPVALVGSPSGQNLYVVNHDDSTVMQFSIGTDGKLYLQNTYNTTGSSPTAVAIDGAGKFLYVTFTYQIGSNGQQLYSPGNPGPGGVSIFPVNADGSLGTASTQNVGNNPVSIVASRPAITDSVGTANGAVFVYVLDQEGTAKAALLGFSQDKSTGALTPTPGTTITTDGTGRTVATGYGAGTTPSAITEDPSARFVYVTDQATNQLYGYLVGTGGSLVTMANGPFSTGLFPVAVTVDPRGKYVYVANLSDATVSSYAIDQSTGTPASVTGSSAVHTETAPNCVTIDPALGIYLYTSNNIGADVTGLQLSPNTGGLQQVQNTPFPTNGLPTCAVAVANGSHPTQLINP